MERAPQSGARHKGTSLPAQARLGLKALGLFFIFEPHK
jgi:hypothetical protein